MRLAFRTLTGLAELDRQIAKLRELRDSFRAATGYSPASSLPPSRPHPFCPTETAL